MSALGPYRWEVTWCDYRPNAEMSMRHWSTQSFLIVALHCNVTLSYEANSAPPL